MKYLKYNAELQGLNFNQVFTPKEKERYEEMFKYFDRAGDSFIKREDLSFGLRALGFLVTTIELRELASYLDPERIQKINLRQFLTGVYCVRNRQPEQNEILNSLRVFDRHNTGYIDVAEVKQILMNIGDIVNASEFDAVFSELNIENGQVSIADLVELLTISQQM